MWSERELRATGWWSTEDTSAPTGSLCRVDLNLDPFQENRPNLNKELKQFLNLKTSYRRTGTWTRILFWKAKTHHTDKTFIKNYKQMGQITFTPNHRSEFLIGRCGTASHSSAASTTLRETFTRISVQVGSSRNALKHKSTGERV